MNEIHYDQLFKELDYSLKISFNQFMAVEYNDIENKRKDFFEFGELEIDRILKIYGLERHQNDVEILIHLNYIRMKLSMQMVEIK